MESRAGLLLSALASPAAEEVKQMAAVLLRRLLSHEFTDLQPKVSPSKLFFLNDEK